MELLKKYLGIIWIVLGIYVGYSQITDSLTKIGSDKLEDRVFGWVILCVLVPIVVGGLILFGKYALDGEYDFKARKSEPEHRSGAKK
ncbi:DUF6814 family protein [Spirosoma jeollabukense]